MNFTTLHDIQAAGFEGFVPVKDLQTTLRRRVIPAQPGNYLILRLSDANPVFHPVGSFNSRIIRAIPYDIDGLREKWADVRQSIVVYIGKAGGEGMRATLRSRLSLYLRLNAHHSGGRAIWQFDDCGELLVCWKAMPTSLNGSTPKTYEAQLIAEFKAQYGTFPLANWIT